MPRYFELPCTSFLLSSRCQYFADPTMQVLPCRSRHRVVRLRPDKLVPKLEPTLHCTQQAFFLEPRQGLAGGGRRQVDHLVQWQVRQPAAEHGGEVERRARGRVQAPELTLEHRPDGPRDPK